MALSANAVAALRAPAPSREKHPGWVVSRTERLPPSRKCKPELLGDDGKREYSFFECVHGCGVSVKVLSDSLKQHKNQAIDDHLVTCPMVDEGQRPAKVARGAISIGALRDPEKLALVPALHKQCDARYETIMKKVEGLESVLNVHNCVLQQFLPSLVLPIREGTEGMVQMKNAIQNDLLQTSSRSLTLHEKSPSSDLEAELMRTRRELQKTKAELRATTDDRDAQVSELRRQIRHADSESRRKRAADYADRQDVDLRFVNAKLEAFARVVIQNHNILAEKQGLTARHSMDEFHHLLRSCHTMAHSPRPE